MTNINELRQYIEELERRIQILEQSKSNNVLPENNLINYLKDTDITKNQKIDNLEVKSAYFDSEVNNGDSGTAKTIDWKLGNKQKITLTGNATLTFLAPMKPCNLILRCIEDGTARTITWSSTVKWDGGSAPTFTGTVNKWYVISFYFDGTNYSASFTTELG